MDDPVTRAAFVWWAAESPPHARWTNKLSWGDILAIAVPRVLAVFSGEVRWSEASPGDKAIWRGRPRDIEAWQKTRRGGTTQVLRGVEWLNLFDTATLGPDDAYRCRRIFNNANIGNQFLTNLQCGGQASFRGDFEIAQGYAVVSRPVTTADDIFITAIIGHHPVHSPLSLREWVLGVPMGVTVPARQSFGAQVESHGPVSAPIDVIVHFEGVERPRKDR